MARAATTSVSNDACCAPISATVLPEVEAEQLARAFAALSDPVRLRLLSFIASSGADEVCACDLTEPAGRSQPTVSHHMKCLASAGLVRSQKRGKWMYYALDARGFKAAKALLENCC